MLTLADGHAFLGRTHRCAAMLHTGDGGRSQLANFMESWSVAASHPCGPRLGANGFHDHQPLHYRVLVSSALLELVSEFLFNGGSNIR